jgi:hypothetical protein
MKLFDLIPADVKAQLYGLRSSHKHDHVPYPHAKRVHRVAGGLMPSLRHAEPESNRGYDVPRAPQSCFVPVRDSARLYGVRSRV